MLKGWSTDVSIGDPQSSSWGMKRNKKILGRLLHVRQMEMKKIHVCFSEFRDSLLLVEMMK